MPIAFPPAIRGRPPIQARYLINNPFVVQVNPNVNEPGVRFTSATLNGGKSKAVTRPNPRSPGVNFAKAFLRSDIEPRPQILTDARLSKGKDGTQRVKLAGVSRDSAGAALASCQIMIFRSVDKVLIAETTSDGSGVWSVEVPAGSQPFFLVEYKDGVTPVAGTSLNTLLPELV